MTRTRGSPSRTTEGPDDWRKVPNLDAYQIGRTPAEGERVSTSASITIAARARCQRWRQPPPPPRKVHGALVKRTSKDSSSSPVQKARQWLREIDTELPKVTGYVPLPNAVDELCGRMVEAYLHASDAERASMRSGGMFPRTVSSLCERCSAAVARWVCRVR